jgi:hypothetical protein
VNAILSSNIYKHPEDYVYGRDTFYVESFNNVINVYQNKRIAFRDEQYNTRNNLAVCHWNENVDREHTSVSNPQNARRSLILVDIYHIVKTFNIKCISSIDIILWMFINV